jgi:hypothetical protein
VKPFGKRGAHILVPYKHIGKRAIIGVESSIHRIDKRNQAKLLKIIKKKIVQAKNSKVTGLYGSVIRNTYPDIFRSFRDQIKRNTMTEEDYKELKIYLSKKL